MLWVYVHYEFLILSVWESTLDSDVRFCRLKSVPALKGFTIFRLVTGPLVQGNIVLDLELREGRQFFTNLLYKVSSNTNKSIELNSLEGGFVPRPFFVSVEMFSVIKMSTSVHTWAICMTFVLFRTVKHI